jgi:hypothetical protein
MAHLIQILGAALSAALVMGQAPPAVLVQQVPAGAAARSNSSSPVASAATNSNRVAIPRAAVEACRRAQLGAAPPEGVDCQQIARLLEAERRRTPEGTLLMLLGQQSNVTQPGPARTVNTADANSVAREVVNGSAQGDAAAVAAYQRGGPSPAPPPR